MKYFVLAILGVSFTLSCGICRGSTFSSTNTLNQSFSNGSIRFFSSATDSTSKVIGSRSGSLILSSGANSESITVDTVSNQGSVSALQFKAFSFALSSYTQDYHVQKLVIDVPGDFPDPGVTHIQDDLYQDQFKVTSVSPITPTFVSSTNGTLDPIYYKSPWFQMYDTVGIASPSFEVQGTYQVNGPKTSRTVPFSVTFEPTSTLSFVQRIAVKGGQNFGNGFAVDIGGDMQVTYHIMNPLIFDEVVDDLRFRASFSGVTSDNIGVMLLRGAQIPEPGILSLGTGILVGLVAVFRRRIE